MSVQNRRRQLSHRKPYKNGEGTVQCSFFSRTHDPPPNEICDRQIMCCLRSAAFVRSSSLNRNSSNSEIGSIVNEIAAAQAAVPESRRCTKHASGIHPSEPGRPRLDSETSLVRRRSVVPPCSRHPRTRAGSGQPPSSHPQWHRTPAASGTRQTVRRSPADSVLSPISRNNHTQ